MALSAVLLLFLSVSSLLRDRQLRVTFPDVGQGDCALISLPSGKTVLIDGGGTRDGRFDIGRRVLAPYLWNRGVRSLDLVILSHPHPDHMAGLVYILNNFDIAEVWESGLDTQLPGHDEFSRCIEDRKIRRRIVSAATRAVAVGDAELSILHPAPGFTARNGKAYADENDRSLVIKVASEGMTMLFTGDIGTKAESELVRTGRELSCDILKVPHHGSKSSSSGMFIERAKPALAVVSVGRSNPYRHPAADVVARYVRQGTRVLRTDVGGALSIKATPEGLVAFRWKDLMLARIELGDRSTWVQRERANISRLWLRTTVF